MDSISPDALTIHERGHRELDVVLRYPGDRMQPYTGAGVGANLLPFMAFQAWGTTSAWGVGLNAMAELRCLSARRSLCSENTT